MMHGPINIRKRNVVRLYQIDGTKFRDTYITFTIIRQDGTYLSTKKKIESVFNPFTPLLPNVENMVSSE